MGRNVSATIITLIVYLQSELRMHGDADRSTQYNKRFLLLYQIKWRFADLPLKGHVIFEEAGDHF